MKLVRFSILLQFWNFDTPSLLVCLILSKANTWHVIFSVLNMSKCWKSRLSTGGTISYLGLLSCRFVNVHLAVRAMPTLAWFLTRESSTGVAARNVKLHLSWVASLRWTICWAWLLNWPKHICQTWFSSSIQVTSHSPTRHIGVRFHSFTGFVALATGPFHYRIRFTWRRGFKGRETRKLMEIAEWDWLKLREREVLLCCFSSRFLTISFLC